MKNIKAAHEVPTEIILKLLSKIVAFREKTLQTSKKKQGTEQKSIISHQSHWWTVSLRALLGSANSHCECFSTLSYLFEDNL